ncbi:MAG TPA: FecR domain-containing protein [Polyangiaceae bacterium]|nr:FecR domain-containing protein [Polyangiaceae bacterium]
MSPHRDLSRYVAIDLSSSRIDRLWRRITPALESSPKRRPRLLVWAPLAALVVSLSVIVALLVPRAAPPVSAWENAALETAGDSLSVRLEDDSRIELSAHSRVELAESTANALRLRLERGAVRCDVTRHRDRHFIVVARGVEVRVLGTRFSVAIGDDRVDVAVERGSVEVRTPGSAGTTRRLLAGERWSIDLDARKRASAASGEPSAVPITPPSAILPAPTPSGRARPAPPADADGTRRLEGASARELFDSANLARRAGDIEGAARAYEVLLARYPRDARAALAAFELGRLRLERLGDPAGAVPVLERAVARAPSAGLREDALARLVQALAASGELERCREERRAYLERYPKGVHVATVHARCPDR